jgi:hypothetical protein
MDVATESPGYESEILSSTKIEPLDSPDKSKAPHNSAHASVIGEDYIIVSSHIAPFEPTEGHKMGSSQQGGMLCAFFLDCFLGVHGVSRAWLRFVGYA